MSTESSRLLGAVKRGGDDAARELFDTYVQRLLGLARTHLSDALQARVDPEDIVQSVFRTFFRKVADEQVLLGRSGDLWRFLAAITVNKARQRVEYELAAKRNPNRERAAAAGAAVLVTDPRDDDVLILVDEVASFLNGLDVRDRSILELRLQGERLDDIATAVGISEATVRRVLDRAGGELQRRLADE